MDSGNIPMTDSQRRDADNADQVRLSGILPNNASALVEPPDPPASEQRHLEEYFPLREAVNPHMSSYERRLETFDRRWPAGKIRASPEQIAKAGFFFLGESDKTKCYYCNGGLQNWDPNDEPWTEHAKWFPGCEFVIRKKGPEFVRRLAEAHPNLNRPYIRNPVSYDIPPPETAQFVTFQSQMRSLDMDSVRSMGFSQENIEHAIRSRLSEGGFAATQDLIDYLLENNRDSASNMETSTVEQVSPPQQINEVLQGPRGPIPAMEVGPTGVKRPIEITAADYLAKRGRISDGAVGLEGPQLESLKEFEETSLCRKCKVNVAEVVLIPCGHFAACEKCGPTIKRCMLCNNKVTSCMKVFRA